MYSNFIVRKYACSFEVIFILAIVMTSSFPSNIAKNLPWSRIEMIKSCTITRGLSAIAKNSMRTIEETPRSVISSVHPAVHQDPFIGGSYTQ